MMNTIRKPSGPLKRGWTTGACATAATKAAFTALISGDFPDPVSITLPKGQKPAFALALEGRGDDWAQAGIIKDAGDDPDVTHGAMIISTVRPAAPGMGVLFKAGEGVGMVTQPGLPIPPGQPAINPVPRQMMSDVIHEIALSHGCAGDVEIEVSIPNGARLAQKTWNPRLGITGGLSILGTTGIVNPFSCAAWIASIHRGIDVARAAGFPHIAGATGSTSEAAVQAHFGLPLEALIDMGDFVGGMLKYLREHPVPHVTVAGGFAKMVKMAQGAMDLHSGRSQVDFDWLAGRIALLGGPQTLCDKVKGANTALQVLELCQDANIAIAWDIANNAMEQGYSILRGTKIDLDTVIVDRKGEILATASG